MRRSVLATAVAAAFAVGVVVALVASSLLPGPGLGSPWQWGDSDDRAADDTVDEPPPSPLRDFGFEAFFTPGTTLISPVFTGTVTVDELGPMSFPSGRIVATDPTYGSDDQVPFTATIAPGSHRVQLSRLTIRYNGGGEDERIAAARILVSDAPVTAWEMALLPDQDAAELSTGQYYGFGVDSGIGCFLDADAIPALDNIAPMDGGNGPLYDAIDTVPGANITDPATGGNVLAWYSGWGDGSYPVWIGRDATGTAVQVVADMLLV